MTKRSTQSCSGLHCGLYFMKSYYLRWPKGQQAACVCGLHFQSSMSLGIHALACTPYGELRTGRYHAVRHEVALTLRQLATGAHIDVEAPLIVGLRKRSDVRFLLGSEVLHVDKAIVNPAKQQALAKRHHKDRKKDG